VLFTFGPRLAGVDQASAVLSRVGVDVLHAQRPGSSTEEEDLQPVASDVRVAVVRRAAAQLGDGFRRPEDSRVRLAPEDVARPGARAREVENRAVPPLGKRKGARLGGDAVHVASEVHGVVPAVRSKTSRERVAGLLFPEAADPLGSLRWTLSVLRRQLGERAKIGGDPLTLTLPPGSFVDVDVLDRGSWVEAVALPGLGHNLLDGMAFRASPGFEIWLESERRHVAGITAAVLHEAGLASLARGDAASARDYAFELVRLNRFDENAHTLLVRCLLAVGDREAAARQVNTCVELFERELGINAERCSDSGGGRPDRCAPGTCPEPSFGACAHRDRRSGDRRRRRRCWAPASSRRRRLRSKL